MGGPPLVVRQKTLVPSKLILGPKKQRPASQNVERVEVDQSNGRRPVVGRFEMRLNASFDCAAACRVASRPSLFGVRPSHKTFVECGISPFVCFVFMLHFMRVSVR